MWLLSTDRAELYLFPSPEEVPDGYAALSHVWDKTEQSFQDVRKIQERCAKNRTNPRDVVCEKIRRCCELAESHGYRWVWIDTCCIDKTSSTELSEAINSMFRYYALARICYGYLRDVDFTDQKERKYRRHELFDRWLHGIFLRSVWFQRGWTLQELLAPRFFLFISRCWRVLGSKADLACQLEGKTKIPAAVLRLEISHTTYSISQRMSWFGSRKTRRLEDQAYCLLGMFDVHMPLLYGEGRNAFQRLQEEIMKQSVDTTLFAWDPAFLVDDQTRSCLLAPSPEAFGPNHLAYIPLHRVWRPHRHGESFLEWDVECAHDMTFSVTSHGVLAYVPIIICKNRIYADLSWCSELHTYHDHPPKRFLLCLEKGSDTTDSRTLYVCRSRLLRIEAPTKSLKYVITGQKARASWQTVLIRHRPPPHRLPGQLFLADPRAPFIPAAPAQLFVDAPFRFDEARIQSFFSEFQAERMGIRMAERRAVSDTLSLTTYLFVRKPRYPDNLMAVVIRLGECLHGGPNRGRRRQVWAVVSGLVWKPSDSLARMEQKMAELSRDRRHVCLEHHVSHWQGLRKRFDLGIQPPLRRAAVSLHFTRCPINPRGTLVLNAAYHRDG